MLNAPKVTIGDNWEKIGTLKRGGGRHYRITDNVTFRITRQKSDNLRIVAGIGRDICDLLKWMPGDELMPLRNKLNGTLIKLIKVNENGYRLCSPNKNPCRYVLNFVFDYHKKYLLSSTKTINFEIDKNSLILDISSLCEDIK